MPSGPFPELRFMIDGQQYSREILSIHDDGDDLTTLGRMQPSRYLRQRGRPRCLGFRTVHVRFRSHGSSVVRLLS